MLLRTLSDEQYQDVVNVCWSYPHLEVVVDAKGKHTMFSMMFHKGLKTSLPKYWYRMICPLERIMHAETLQGHTVGPECQFLEISLYFAEGKKADSLLA